MQLQERVRQGWLVLIKHSLNRVTRRVARSHVGPFALVQHVGRRSGKPYETPIIVSPVGPNFMMELTYGPNVDWYKNIKAAGGCTLIWHGAAYTIDAIDPVDTTSGLSAFPMPARFILRMLQRTHFERMHVREKRSLKR